MNKSFWLFTLICSLFVSAITTVLSLSGALSIPILVFPVLSLVIPIMVRRLKNAKFNDDLPLSMGYHAYSWAWWAVFSFLHTPFSFNVDNGLAKVLLLFVVYFIVQVLIELCGLLATKFFNRTHRWGMIDEALDIIVYTIPIPFLYIGYRINGKVFTISTLFSIVWMAIFSSFAHEFTPITTNPFDLQ